MVERILVDNSNNFDKQLLAYSIQLNALNYLKKNNQIKEDCYIKVKSALSENYRMESN